jgi:peptidylprolyl isomerase
MKFLALIAGLFLGVASVGCGGEERDSVDPMESAAARAAKPKIEFPLGPPPKKLVVRELRKGSGPAVKKADDEIFVNYAGAEYETGVEFFNSWEVHRPARFLLEETRKGWEIGLKGIRPGGRRELLLPSNLAYGSGPLVYIVELIAVNGKRSPK